MTLPAALLPLVERQQWVTYRKVPDAITGKTDKCPCYWQTGNIASAHVTAHWTTYENALAHVGLADRGHGAGVGFVLTANDPFWFLDIDKCLVNGEWSPLATSLCQRLTGAAVEISQSNQGLHILGAGPVPSHRCKNVPLGLELYTEGRFVAITGTQAQGNAAADRSAQIAGIVAEFFAPISGAARGPLDEWTSEPCDGWAGPVDDDELIRQACASVPKVSAASALRPGSERDTVSFRQLWEADPIALGAAWPDTGGQNRAFDASGPDLSLAGKLAYWTGRDCERIERLMRMSGLYRDKYEQRYYIERTIRLAAGGCENVRHEKPADPDLPPAPPIEVRTKAGEMRVLSLTPKQQEDKTDHQTIEYWLSARGYSASFDEFASQYLLNGQRLTDETENAAWLAIREVSTLKFAYDLFGRVLRNIGWSNRFHPLTDWLADVQPTWDGVPRIDTWFSAYLGAPDSPYVRAVSAIFLTAAVRRAREPGVKFDEIVVLEGPQGIEKSTAIAMLCPTSAWFCDDFNVSMDSRELLEITEGKWIVEAPELSKLTNAEVEHVKHLLSRRVDKARKAYGRTTTERGRQWVPVASTNATRYLTDPTGNRRFWPITCTAIDLAAIMRDREQLWAEAAQREAAGGSIRLDRALWADAAIEQNARVAVDPIQERLEPLLISFDAARVSAPDIWLAIGISDVAKQMQIGPKIGNVMRRLGWERGPRLRSDGARPYSYVKHNGPEIFWDISTQQFIRDRPTQPANLTVVK